MKISIITVCYNREKTIRDSIESVLAQDCPEVEYIVVDGASTDGTLKIVDEYAQRIDHILSEPDKGMYEALNRGIRMATGDIIGLLHSDDVFFQPTTLSRVLRRFEETGADLVYGDGLFVDPDDPQRVVRNWIGGNYHRWKVRYGWLPLHTTCFIRRTVMERCGLYDESYKIAADSDLLFRYLLDGKLHVEYLHEYIVKMRMGGLSTDGAHRKQMWNEDIRMFRSLGMHPYVTKIEKMLWKVPQFVKSMKQNDNNGDKP